VGTPPVPNSTENGAIPRPSSGYPLSGEQGLAALSTGRSRLVELAPSQCPRSPYGMCPSAGKALGRQAAQFCNAKPCLLRVGPVRQSVSSRSPEWLRPYAANGLLKSAQHPLGRRRAPEWRSVGVSPPREMSYTFYPSISLIARLSGGEALSGPSAAEPYIPVGGASGPLRPPRIPSRSTSRIWCSINPRLIS
jgi:hypothetical protein